MSILSRYWLLLGKGCQVGFWGLMGYFGPLVAIVSCHGSFLSGFVFLLFAVLCMFQPSLFVFVFRAAVFFRRRALTVRFVVEKQRKKTFFSVFFAYFLLFCFFPRIEA